jgi:hypothetical protein
MKPVFWESELFDLANYPHFLLVFLLRSLSREFVGNDQLGKVDHLTLKWSSLFSGHYSKQSSARFKQEQR